MSLSTTGQPLAVFAASSGQLSSLSGIPSWSLSGHGQPLFSAGPATLIQLS